jgi:hypothetical protein
METAAPEIRGDVEGLRFYQSVKKAAGRRG